MTALLQQPIRSMFQHPGLNPSPVYMPTLFQSAPISGPRVLYDISGTVIEELKSCDVCRVKAVDDQLAEFSRSYEYVMDKLLEYPNFICLKPQPAPISYSSLSTLCARCLKRVHVRVFAELCEIVEDYFLRASGYKVYIFSGQWDGLNLASCIRSEDAIIKTRLTFACSTPDGRRRATDFSVDFDLTSLTATQLIELCNQMQRHCDEFWGQHHPSEWYHYSASDYNEDMHEEPIEDEEIVVIDMTHDDDIIDLTSDDGSDF